MAALVAAAVSAIPSGAALAGVCHLASYGGALPVEIIDQRATTLVKFNGRETRVMLDSGAFFNFMSQATAAQLGLRIGKAPSEITPSSTGSHLGRSAYMIGTGGNADVGSTTVSDFGIFGATVHKVLFLVGGSDLGMPIIGANLLDAFDLDIDLGRGKLNLMQASGCSKGAQAYWVKDGPFQMADLDRDAADNKSYVTVVINGHPVRALIDTGAPATILARHAAERAGIDLTSSKVKPADSMSGIGAISYRTWIAPIDRFQVGTETVQHSQMLVLDGPIAAGIDAPDMLLGLDFVLAHHMYIANGEGKIYFTYNGGRIFALAKPPPAQSPQGGASATPAGAAGTPTTAAEFALRGEAGLARGEVAAAIADLDSAIRLDPGKPGYYLARAQATAQSGRGDGGLGDLNRALALDPQNVETLLWRARFYVRRQDYDAARADMVAARKLAPEGSRQALSIADFDIKMDQPAEALPIYDAWIRLHPVDSSMGLTLNARCWARGLANQGLDGALADCRKAIKLDGPVADYLDSMSLVLLRQGNFAEAVATYDRALAVSPHRAWSLFGRALAERHLGQADASTTDMNAARAIMPQIGAKAAKYGLALP